jgi:hypothetical protein
MRYHKDIGFPETLIFPDSIWKLIYTDHALIKGEKIYFYDWIHDIRKIKKETIIEVVTDDNKLVLEVVIRLPYQTGYDVSLALDIVGKTAIVKTLWLNRKKDTHQTLDKTIYDIPKTKQLV